MQRKILALLVALGMIIMLFGCGNGEDLENVQDQLANLQNELADLQDEYDALARDYAALQLENDALQGQIAGLQSDVDALLLSNDAFLAEVMELEAEYFELLGEHLELLELLNEDADEDEEDEDENDSEENNQTSDTTSLVGTWLWAGTPYYVFNEDGTGTMVGEDILWTTRNGILIVCATPDVCEGINACAIPQEWYYEIDGDELILDSRQLANFSFTYTRQ